MPDLKKRLDGLEVVHSVDVSMRRAGVEPTELNVKHWRSMPDKVQKLVLAERRLGLPKGPR